MTDRFLRPERGNLRPTPAALAQQVSILHAGLPAAAAGNLLLAVITSWALWNVVPHASLLIWAATFATVQIARLALWASGPRKSDGALTGRRRVLLRTGALLSGVAWGALPVFLFPDDIPHQAFLSFVAAGVTGAAVAALASDRISALLFIAPALLPLIVRLFVDGGEIPAAMGAMGTLYLLYLIATVHRGERAFQDVQALRERADRQNADLRDAQRLARLGSWTLDVSSGRLEWSDEVYAIYGRDPANYSPNRPTYYRELVHPDDVQNVRSTEQAAYRVPGQRHSIDHRVILPDGGVRWVHIDGVALPNDAGQPARVTGTVQDITDRKRFESALRESEARLQTAQEIARLGYFRSDLRTGTIEWSDRLCRMLGYAPGEVLPTLEKFAGSIVPEERERVMGVVRRAYSSIYAVRPGERAVLPAIEYRALRQDGEELWLRSEAQAELDESGRPVLVQGTVQDITARKQTERELLEKQQSPKLALDASRAGYYILDLVKGRGEWDDRAYSVYGQIRGSFDTTLENITGAVIPEDRDMLTRFGELLQSPGTDWHEIYRVRAADGSIRTIEGFGYIVRAPDRTALRVIGTVVDITERKQSEEALRRAHAKSQGILDAIPDLMLQLDEEGRFVDYHAINSRDLAFPPEAFMGRTVEEVLPDFIAARAREAMCRAHESDMTEIFEYTIPDQRGLPQEWEARFAPVVTGGTLVIIRNITDRKKVERMKNEFVSTVSHELRTPLTSIKGALGLIAGGVAGPIPAKAQELVDIAHKNCERLARLIGDILDVERIESGSMRFTMQPHTVMTLIDQSVTAYRSYGEQFQVRFAVTEALPDVRVLVDAERFMQVMANLLSNAAKFWGRAAGSMSIFLFCRPWMQVRTWPRRNRCRESSSARTMRISPDCSD